MNRIKLAMTGRKWAGVFGLLLRRGAIAACGVFVIGVLPAAAETSRSGEVWHDELTIKEVVSGKVTPYDQHEASIPGDVIADKMNSRADAQALWGSQGGTVSEYTGCGSCGVGSKITVVVTFSSVIDTHVFKRDK